MRTTQRAIIASWIGLTIVNDKKGGNVRAPLVHQHHPVHYRDVDVILLPLSHSLSLSTLIIIIIIIILHYANVQSDAIVLLYYSLFCIE